MDNQTQPNQPVKTNWKYILIVAILAVIIGGGIMWWVKKQEISFAPLPEIIKSEKSVQDETADWKIYRNEEYGFEVKYPKNFQILNFESTVPFVNIPLIIANAYIGERDSPGNGEMIVNFYIFNETWPDLDNFVNARGLPINGAEKVINDHNRLVGNYLPDGSEITENDVVFYNNQVEIDGKTAVRQILECRKFCAFLNGKGVNIDYFIKQNQKFYKIWAGLSEKNDNLENIFDQIISTLKFL